MDKRKRRIMRSFKMREISAVDQPAQEGAQVAIMKRQAPALIEIMTTVHDDVPVAERREFAALIGNVENAITKQDDVDLRLLASRIEDVARKRLGALVAALRDGTGMDTEDAQRAAQASRAGQMLETLIDLAADMSRVADAAPDVAGAQAEKRLDEMAKARAEARGENFYDAYEKVCDANPDLVVKAVGEPAQPAAELTDEEFEFDLAVRTSPMTKALDTQISTREAERYLLSRAKEIQVERASQQLSLPTALEVAKAERPDLARHAFD